MHNNTYRASADYTVIDRNPLHLDEGDLVQLGPLDPAWEGWIWVNSADGRGSHVPEEILERLDDNKAIVRASFTARDLSVSKGEELVSLSEVKGWHWCRNNNSQQGWVPAYLLKEV